MLHETDRLEVGRDAAEALAAENDQPGEMRRLEVQIRAAKALFRAAAKLGGGEATA